MKTDISFKRKSALKNSKDLSALSMKLKIFNTFWNSSRDAFYLCDSNLNLLDINRAGLKRLNKKKQEVVGMNILDYCPHLKNSGRYTKYLEVLKTGKPLVIKETKSPFVPGSYISVFVFKVMDGLGAIIKDITTNHKSEGDLKNSYQLMKNLSLHLNSLKEEESLRIAREIHNEMAPVLTTFKMDLYWLLSKLREESKLEPLVEKKVDEMADLMDKTITSIRKVCSELRPALLDELGLFDAMKWQVQEFQKRFPLKYRLNLECDGKEFSPDLSLCLFRIFQEALTNIVRHANATKAFVSLRQIPAKNALMLIIRDNGRGIRQEEIANPSSFGLIGMRERLSPYNGWLKIKGVPDKGTTLTVAIPLASKRTMDEGCKK
jgi:signal transduction histidine kinase